MKLWAKIIIGDSRELIEIENESIGLIITSPPYWHIKDYGVPGQIGYGQNLHEYLKDLYRVWKECFRVLKPGRRLCINIGDQFVRSVIYGRYKVIPLHAEIILQCEKIGFDYMGAIIWQKKTTMNTTGGATVMGSYPYPPNGMIEIDHEFILIFKKPGKGENISHQIKEISKLTKEEWKEYFSGHWKFGGERQINHEAMFPEELPRRLIKMYSFVGDTVLDPFLGSGTTVKVALELKRNAIGYEINESFLKIITKKIGLKESLFETYNVEVIKRSENIKPKEIDYEPNIQDAKPLIDLKKIDFRKNVLYKVVEIVDENTIKLNSNLLVKFLGVEIIKKKETIVYLKNYILNKDVILRFENGSYTDSDAVYAYVYLKNKIFVNAYLIKSGLARADRSKDYRMKEKFVKLEEMSIK
uniref:Methyltransferase n=1 Tax=candidate division WOR-3 bacterium TaxID=2052148 RepID=A0A7V4E3N7_UNCW3